MLVANIEWVFTRPDWVDTWMYFGFFRHYDVSDYLAGNKKIARLPWILVGFVINKLFTPTVAAIVLHVGCFALGAFYFYRLAFELFGRPAAVIATLAYITWVPNHGSGGWDYHNTLLPVLYFTAYRALIWASSAERGKFAKFFVFGVLYALAVHTNLLVILLVPALIARAVYQRRRTDVRGMNGRWLRDVATGTVLGGLSITCVLGLVNVISGRSFFFWNILVSRSAFLVEHPVLEKSWWFPWSDPWWTSNIDTPMINVVVILILAFAVFHRHGWSLRASMVSSAACAMLEYMLSVAVFAFGQTLGHPLLEPFYMAMPLTLPMFLAIAALVSEIGSDVRYGTALTVFAASAFGLQFVGRLSISPDLFFNWKPGTWTSDLPPMIVIMAGFAIAAVIKRLSFQFPQTGTLAACGCIALALGQANMLWPIATDDRAPYDYRRVDCKVNQTLLSAVAEADDILYPLLKEGHQIALWYRGDEFAGSSPSCRLANYQLGRPLYAMNYGAANVHYWDPETDVEIPDRMLDQIVARRNVLVLVTNDNTYVSRTVARMHLRDHGWGQSAIYTVGKNGITFGLHVITAPPPR